MTSTAGLGFGGSQGPRVGLMQSAHALGDRGVEAAFELFGQLIEGMSVLDLAHARVGVRRYVDGVGAEVAVEQGRSKALFRGWRHDGASRIFPRSGMGAFLIVDAVQGGGRDIA